MLGRLRLLAESPVRPLPPIDPTAFAERMAMLYTLPRQRGAGEIAATLKGSAYDIVLGHLPYDQIDWMVREALRTCEWCPPPAKCLSIAEGWERSDDAVQARQEAKKRAHLETMARSEDCTAARRRMERGGMEQGEIDALPPWVVAYLLKVRELVRCDDCGSLAPARRSRPEPIVADAELEEIIARVGASLSPKKEPTHAD